jgi:hypothetical protein
MEDPFRPKVEEESRHEDDQQGQDEQPDHPETARAVESDALPGNRIRVSRLSDWLGRTAGRFIRRVVVGFCPSVPNEARRSTCRDPSRLVPTEGVREPSLAQLFHATSRPSGKTLVRGSSPIAVTRTTGNTPRRHEGPPANRRQFSGAWASRCSRFAIIRCQSASTKGPSALCAPCAFPDTMSSIRPKSTRMKTPSASAVSSPSW